MLDRSDYRRDSEARMTEPKGPRQCPGCSQPIKGASLFHDFLRRHYPSSFCAPCLSTALDLMHEQVEKFVTASRADRRLVILLGARCASKMTSQIGRAHVLTPVTDVSRMPSSA